MTTVELVCFFCLGLALLESGVQKKAAACFPVPLATGAGDANERRVPPVSACFLNSTAFSEIGVLQSFSASAPSAPSSDSAFDGAGGMYGW